MKCNTHKLETKFNCLGDENFLIFKGTFYSERADEMWNRQIKVPKIVRGLLFSVSDINCSNKMVIFTFFYINQINLCKARTNRY